MRPLLPQNLLSCTAGIMLLAFGFSYASNDDTVKLSSIEIVVDNDHFRLIDKSDKFYSSGLYITAWSDSRKRSSSFGTFSRNTPKVPIRYGLSLSHLIITPTNIKQPDFTRPDYPFSSFMLLSMVSETAQDQWTYGIGARGPLTMGKALQSGAHSIFGYAEPKGWENQLPNMFIYQVGWRRQSIEFTHKNLAINGNYYLQLGNFRTSGMSGLDIGISIGPVLAKIESWVEVVLYNGQFQSGWTTSNLNFHPFVGHFRFMAEVDLGHLRFCFGQWFVSSELRTREAHGWGRVGMRWDLRTKH